MNPWFPVDPLKCQFPHFIPQTFDEPGDVASECAVDIAVWSGSSHGPTTG